MPVSKLAPALLACAALCACKEPSQPTGQPGAAPAATPTAGLRVSMIPTTDPGKAMRESQPLVDYLGRVTNTKVALTIPANYAAPSRP